MNEHTIKGHLPPAVLSESLLQQLQDILGSEDTYIWEAVVGIGGERFDKGQERPTTIITEWSALIELLRKLPYIDSLNITFEFAGMGVIALAFRNYPPAGGSFVVSGTAEEWTSKMATFIKQLFNQEVDSKTSRLYNRWVFASIQTAIPIMASFFVVLILSVMLVPRELILSGYIWWVTAATLMATLWLANMISDRFVLHVLNRYPYLRWQ